MKINMYLYYIPIIILLTSYLFKFKSVDLTYKKNHLVNLDTLIYGACLFFIYIITAFKGNIDPDYLNYKYYFDIIPKITELNEFTLLKVKESTSNVEISLIYLFSLFKFLHIDFQFFYITILLIIVFLINKLSYYFPNKSLFLLVIYCFYFQGLFIFVRYQIGALCALLIIFNYSKKNKVTISSIFYFIFGISFHSVTIFCIPALLLFKLRKKILNIYLILLIVPIFMSQFDLTLLLNIATLINPRYINYLDNYHVVGSISSLLIREVLIFFLLFLAYLDKQKITETIKDNILTMQLLLLLLLLFIWSVAWRVGILYRIALLYDIAWIFFFSLILKNNLLNNIKNFTLILYLLLRLQTGISELSTYSFY
ncbi:EpsG family protein [Proteus terrae]